MLEQSHFLFHSSLKGSEQPQIRISGPQETFESSVQLSVEGSDDFGGGVTWTVKSGDAAVTQNGEVTLNKGEGETSTVVVHASLSENPEVFAEHMVAFFPSQTKEHSFINTEDSRGVKVYYSFNGRPLELIDIGEEITVEASTSVTAKDAIMFFVIAEEGYRTNAKFEHSSNMEGLSNRIENAPEQLVGRDFTNAISDAKVKGCILEFHFSKWGNEYREREFTLQTEKIKLGVEYLAGKSDSGVSGLPSDHKRYTIDDELTISTQKPQRKGYNFAGWKLLGTEFVYPGGEKVPLRLIWSAIMDSGERIQLEAQWTEQKRINIFYEAKGNGSVSRVSESLDYGEDAKGSNAAGFQGYRFLKWTDVDNEHAEDISGGNPLLKPETKDGKYYAWFTEDFDVTKDVVVEYHIDNTKVHEEIYKVWVNADKVAFEEIKVPASNPGLVKESEYERVSPEIDQDGMIKIPSVVTDPIKVFYVTPQKWGYTVEYYKKIGDALKSLGSSQEEIEPYGKVTEDMIKFQFKPGEGYIVDSVGSTQLPYDIKKNDDTIRVVYEPRRDLEYEIQYYADGEYVEEKSIHGTDGIFGERILQEHQIPDRIVYNNANYVFEKSHGIKKEISLNKNDNIVSLDYTIDEIGGGEDLDQPNEWPDKYEIILNYVSGENGIIEGTTKELLKKYQEGGHEKPKGVTVHPNKGYKFVRWELSSPVLLNGKEVRSLENESDIFDAIFLESTQLTAIFSNIIWDYTVEYYEKIGDALESLGSIQEKIEAYGKVTEDMIKFKFKPGEGYIVDSVGITQLPYDIKKNGDTIRVVYEPRRDLEYEIAYYLDGRYVRGLSIRGQDGVFGEKILKNHEIRNQLLYQEKNYIFESAIGEKNLITLDNKKNVVRLYYASDEIGGGEDFNKPDAIPDKYEIIIEYTSDDKVRVEGETKEVLLRLDENGNYDNTAKGVAKAQVQVVPSSGYEFAGWELDVAAELDGSQVFYFENTQQIKEAKFNENTTLRAIAKARNDTKYQIEVYRQQEGQYLETPSDINDRFGETGTRIEIIEKDYETQGYILDGSKNNQMSGIISPDGSLVLKVYLKQQLTVRYEPGEYGSFMPQRYTALDFNSQTPKFTGSITGKRGYAFMGWDKDLTPTVTSDVVYTAKWRWNSGFDNGSSSNPGALGRPGILWPEVQKDEDQKDIENPNLMDDVLEIRAVISEVKTEEELQRLPKTGDEWLPQLASVLFLGFGMIGAFIRNKWKEE